MRFEFKKFRTMNIRKKNKKLSYKIGHWLDTVKEDKDLEVIIAAR